MNSQPENKTAGEVSGKVPQFSVGTALREAREQLGLSIADVANRIKFAPRQIEAMEADDFAHLPEMTFVRGFVRSYARLLEMDAAPLLAALPQKQVPLSATPESRPVEVSFPFVLTLPRANIRWLAGGFLVALALIIFSRMHDTSSDLPARPVAQTNVEMLELPSAALGAASAPAAEAPSTASVAAPASVRAPVATTPPVKTPLAQAQPVKDRPVKTVRSVVSQNSVAASGSAATAPVSMRLVFDEDSWVDVKDANGKVLLSKMNHAGSLVRLSGIPPVSVVIGHASGVHLFYAGKEINLAPYTSVEVARLLLE